MAMITGIEDFFTKGCGRCARFDTADCSALLWRAGLSQLRALLRGAGLVETVKWGHPCYLHAGRNLAIIGAFRQEFRLTFFHAALLKDPERVLERQGENTRHADMIRFTDAAQVTALAPVIRAYVAEAMGYADAGVVPVREQAALDLPGALVTALDADPDYAEAFHRLTPGRQRSYVIALSSAKTEATRVARVEKFRDKVLAGKGATER
ncbi:YdeI/OmpD-associated family protein [Pseudotabrizicola sp. 4114]|uniref:YdeI/OmpD-associated family protein n=1 Tax=Pseudotabrizicola sp. 4114 TaxID=2817731 RepID=UPI002856994E|nr:uncharacterized protein YdeI (YjbR/CyaY-like superfamily) [Pseudorhodobacter sp. 4114]